MVLASIVSVLNAMIVRIVRTVQIKTRTKSKSVIIPAEDATDLLPMILTMIPTPTIPSLPETVLHIAALPAATQPHTLTVKTEKNIIAAAGIVKDARGLTTTNLQAPKRGVLLRICSLPSGSYNPRAKEAPAEIGHGAIGTMTVTMMMKDGKPPRRQFRQL